MNTSGRSRGSAWWARCLRASSESTWIGPRSRGRQCSTATWTTHSISGNAARSAAGIASSHQPPAADRDPRGHGADQEAADQPGRRCGPEGAPRAAERERRTPGLLAHDPGLVGGQPLGGEGLDLGGRLGHRASSSACASAASRLCVAGRSTRSAAARAVSGSFSPRAAASTR